MEPEKLSVSVRDQIRVDLLDADMLVHLEGCGSINWNTTPTWQYKVAGMAGGVEVEQEWVDAGHLSQYLEVCG